MIDMRVGENPRVHVRNRRACDFAQVFKQVFRILIKAAVYENDVPVRRRDREAVHLNVRDRFEHMNRVSHRMHSLQDQHCIAK